jgi:hypothetical protein
VRNRQSAKFGFISAGIVVVGTLRALSVSDVASSAELVWTGDFETGDFAQYQSKLSGEGTRSAKKIVTSPVRGGRYATELTILGVGIDGGTERAELVTRTNVGEKIFFEWDGPEYWIGFSFLFKEWEADAFTFFQVHAPNESDGNKCDYAGNAFSVWGEGEDSNEGIADTIDVRVIEDGGVSEGKGAASNSTAIHSYGLPIGKWQDYVVNFKLSTHGDGFYKVWKNGELIYSKSGLTNVNYRDSCGNPIPKNKRKHDGVHVGVYAPGGPAYRRIFYDEVRVATGPNGFDLVTPDQNGSPSVPSESESAESAPKAPVIIID